MRLAMRPVQLSDATHCFVSLLLWSPLGSLCRRIDAGQEIPPAPILFGLWSKLPWCILSNFIVSPLSLLFLFPIALSYQRHNHNKRSWAM